MRLTIMVNDEPVIADDVWPGESLLYVLRERLGLPGSKNACEQGECGSCTVLLDGLSVCACLVAAGQAEGRRVHTVEGLAGMAGPAGADPAGAGADGGRGSRREPEGPRGRGDQQARSCGDVRRGPLQEAFIRTGAVQCGFCTPGLLVQAHDLIERTVAVGRPAPTDAEIREALAGNLCRCTGYEKILDAVRLAAAERAQPEAGGRR
jgi:aerobic carbon-monoxide dehydrogenase small subunit